MKQERTKRFLVRVQEGDAMKRILRILVGLPLCCAPMFVGTWVWLFQDENEGWIESVGSMTWYLASGQWDKLPD